MSASAAPAHLSPGDLDALARELDAIGAEVRAELGASDAAYIRKVIAVQRGLETGGRGLLVFSRRTPALVAGTALLTVAKVLENMEIGHNVMHGQWDWMRDPAIHSTTWEWDAASTAQSWKISHNVTHHTYTNVLGKDRDLGYSAMRVDPEQPWRPIYLLQPIYGVLMAMVFEWGIALYDMELDAVQRGEKSKEQARTEMIAFAHKAARQLTKDYILFPALSGRSWRRTLAATVVANVIRNVWVHTIVFMGHIPDGAQTFTEEQYARETRGGWYARQLSGSCNLEGSPLFHIMSGHLSFQIEHHLYPDLPCNRYAQIAPRVRAVCERYGLPYLTGRLGRQYRSVGRKILRLSLPGGGPKAAPAPAAPTPAAAPGRPDAWPIAA
jgi:linoleoyl-CoA desaturase